MGPKNPGMAPKEARLLSRGGESKRIRQLGWDPKTQGWLPKRPAYSPVAGSVNVSGSWVGAQKPRDGSQRGPFTPVAGVNVSGAIRNPE